MIDWILSKIGWILAQFNTWTGNYLLAVLLFALLFKIILFPFSLKQQKSQLKQAKLQPKAAAIKKKYNGRNDTESKQKMQQEIMEMYQSEGYNQMSGCLPLLLQLPIIMALYSIIQNPLRYICGVSKDAVTVVLKAAKEVTGTTYNYSLAVMQDLQSNWDAISTKVTEMADGTDVSSFTNLSQGSLPDFKVFGLNLSATPMDAKGWYFLIPVLTFVILFLTSKLTRKLSYIQQDPQMEGGCSGWIMDFVAPAMSTYFALVLPSLLGVYWMFNNLLGVLQSLILRAMYPAPVFTEADYKEAERAMRGKGSKTIATDNRVIPGKKYVSLHHIDDDDEMELPVLPLDSREKDDDSDADTDKPEAPKLKDESDRPTGKKKNGKK